MDKYVQIFKDFILHDKEFVDDIIKRFYKEVRQIGELLEKESNQFYYSISPKVFPLPHMQLVCTQLFQFPLSI